MGRYAHFKKKNVSLCEWKMHDFVHSLNIVNTPKIIRYNREKELLDKGSQTRKDLINTLDNAKELYLKAKNGDKEAEEQFLNLTGKKNLENGFNYLKPYLGDESTWGDKSTEQLFDDYLSTGKLSKTANHVKGILRYIVNGTSKDNPNFDKSRELYNEFMSNKTILDEKLEIGAFKAKTIAKKTINRVRNVMGY